MSFDQDPEEEDEHFLCKQAAACEYERGRADAKIEDFSEAEIVGEVKRRRICNEEEYQRGRADERKAIVEYLRGTASDLWKNPHERNDSADEIEAGEHLKEGK